VTKIKKNIKVMKENNTTHGTDDAAVFSMKTHTSMNGTQKSVGCW